MSIHGFVERVEPSAVAGWCRDAARPEAALTVSARLDGRELARGIADLRRSDLAAAGFGEGRHAFRLVLPHPLDPAQRARLGVVAASGGAERVLPRLGAQAVETAAVAAPGGRRAARCVLHIGTEKTGTTSLQAALAANRALLLDHGVLAPVAAAPHAALGVLNHIGLATYALDIANLAEPLRVAQGGDTAEGVRRHRGAVAAALSGEVGAALAQGRVHTLLFSSEHCSSRLFLPQELARLRALLLGLAERVEIVVYIRPQHEMAVSLISTMLRNGMFETPPWFAAFWPRPILGGPPPAEAARGEAEAVALRYYDHDRLVARWEEGFGPANVAVRRFVPDVVGDFLGRLGDPDGRPLDLGGRRAVAAQNQGLPGSAQAVLLAFNRALAGMPEGEAAALRGRAIAALEGKAPAAGRGGGVLPGRAEAASFQARFDAANERLRARRFPALARLFEPDLSRYPEVPPPLEPPAAEMAALAVALLRQGAGEGRGG